jgi:DNA-directed RNA polymerase specialized sigma subunit
LRNSFIFTDFKEQNERVDFLQSTVDENILHEIKKASNLVVTSIDEKTPDIQLLKKIFKDVEEYKERNKKIYVAYNEGYSQHSIAECLGFSQPYINKIIKRMRSLEL